MIAYHRRLKGSTHNKVIIFAERTSRCSQTYSVLSRRLAQGVAVSAVSGHRFRWLLVPIYFGRALWTCVDTFRLRFCPKKDRDFRAVLMGVKNETKETSLLAEGERSTWRTERGQKSLFIVVFFLQL